MKEEEKAFETEDGDNRETLNNPSETQKKDHELDREREIQDLLKETHPLKSKPSAAVLTEEEVESLYEVSPRRRRKQTSVNPRKVYKIGITLTILLGIGIISLLALQINRLSQKAQAAAAQELQDQIDPLRAEIERLKLEKLSLQEQIERLSEENVQLQTELDASKPETASNSQTQSVNQANSDPAKASSQMNTDQVDLYTVQRGDTLWAISVKMYGSGKYYTEIIKANDMKNAEDIFVGMKLKIPKM